MHHATMQSAGSETTNLRHLPSTVSNRIFCGPASARFFADDHSGDLLLKRTPGPRTLLSVLAAPLRTLDEIRLVAAWDMTRQARRPSFFVMRMALAGFIAFQIVMIWWGQIEERRWWSDQENGAVIPINQIVYAIERIFSGSIVVMSIGLILFCPALTSGTIAGDRERKIWHDLANSPLSGWSILMGKMVARLATVFAWILVAMPLWALMSLLGGLDPLAISLIMLGMFFYGWIYAALGLLASVATKRSRDALGLVTAFVCMLIFVPLVMPELLREFRLHPPWLKDISEWATLLNPVMTLPEVPRWIGQPLANRRTAWISLPVFYLVIGLTGPLLTLLAGVLLRPLGRRLDSDGRVDHAGSGSAAAAKSRLRRRSLKANLLELRPFRLLSAPMIAKERRVRPGSRLTRNLRRVALGLYLGTSLAILGYNLPAAIMETMTYGLYSPLMSGRSPIVGISLTITFCSSILLAYGMMLDAAGRLVMEKEQDTWTTLLSTPLEPYEILAGKAFGALWSWRWVLAHLGFVWAAALAVGAMSPVGLILSLAVWPIQLGFMVVLGLRIGMNSSSHATVVSKCIGLYLMLQILLPIVVSWFVRSESALMTQQAMTAIVAASAGIRDGIQIFGKSNGFGVFFQICQLIATMFILAEVLSTFERKSGRD
jgi:ABC-type transport system involved in multi-copper enzyme maturation permease subunit